MIDNFVSLFNSTHLVWLHRIVLSGPVLSLGVDVYPDVLIHVLRVVNFYQIAPWSQTLYTTLNVYIDLDPLEGYNYLEDK